MVVIKGKTLPVKTGVPLKAGAQITLLVKNTSPDLILQYIGEKAAGPRQVNLAGMIAALKGNLWKTAVDTCPQNGDLQADQKDALATLWSRMTGEPQESISPGRLQAMVDMGGLSLEAKIKNCLLGGRGKAAVPVPYAHPAWAGQPERKHCPGAPHRCCFPVFHPERRTEAAADFGPSE